MEFTLSQITQILEGQLEGDGNIKVTSLAKLSEAGNSDISFFANPKYEDQVYTTDASAIIVGNDFTPKKQLKPALIKVDDPYLSFTALLQQYHKMVTQAPVGVEEPSYMGEQVKEGSGVYRGAFSYVGKQTLLGNNVKIYPHAYVGEGVEIGDNTIIYAGAKIYGQCKIGKNCVIHSGVVIGSDGFGFAPAEDGSYSTIPQVGNVVVGDNVDIGANTVIDRATMGSTIIKSGTKLDNLIQIAHNVEIGAHTVIAAQAGISGSSKIGDYCMVGGQVGVSGHISIADKTKIAAQSGLMKNIVDQDKTFLGSPVMEIGNAMKSYSVYRKLPELQKKIREIENKLKELTSS